MPLIDQNIESELSYSYLHAVASKGGMNCQYGNRHADNYGIDATIEFYDNIPGTIRSDVTLRVQLKATKKSLKETATHYSFWFDGKAQYDRMRLHKGEPYRLLVVMLLPDNPNDWLTCGTDNLVLKKRSAYWISLVGAPESSNAGGETIYIPKTQILTPDSLRNICQQIAL